MDLTCPHCHSDQTQKVSAIVSAGTTYSSGSTTTVGLANTGNDLAAGSAVGTVNMTNTSDLAQRLAPPEMKDEEYIGKFIKWALILIIPGFLAGFFSGNIAYSVIGTDGFGRDGWGRLSFAGIAIWSISFIAPYLLACHYLLKRLKISAAENKAWNIAEGSRQLAYWQHSFYCHRCGQTFVPQSN